VEEEGQGSAGQLSVARKKRDRNEEIFDLSELYLDIKKGKTKKRGTRLLPLRREEGDKGAFCALEGVKSEMSASTFHTFPWVKGKGEKTIGEQQAS